MKLALVVPGGVARLREHGCLPWLHWLIERLASRHEVHVFSLYDPRWPERYSLYGAQVHHSGARPVSLRTLAGIVAEHGRGPFDVLHAFWAAPPGVIAAVAAKLLRRPMLLHLAGNELIAISDIGYGGLLSWRGRFWARIANSTASCVTAASAPMIAAARARGWSVERVPLGVDLRRWPPLAPRPREAGSAARIVHVANLNNVKDQSTLLAAARDLADRGVAFRLDIAGQDTLGGAVQARAKDLGLAGHVSFHGRLDHEHLYPLVAGADLLWVSSRHEAGPLVVLEAAVVGVPTVGTAVGHIAEWTPDAAVSVPVRDHEALARETVTLLGDEPRRLALAREAQRRALACDADWTAARFEALYQEIVTAAKQTGHVR